MTIPTKRIINIFLMSLSIAILIGGLYTVQQIIRRITLRRAAAQISEQFFKGSAYTVDYVERQVVFAEKEVDFLKKYKLNGKVIFYFPVKFFELPWRINMGRITVEGVHWELDLKNKKLNGFDSDEFLTSVSKELDIFKRKKDGKYPVLMTVGNMTLINPEGKKRELSMKSIFQEFNDKVYLLGIHAGDMKVNFLYKDSSRKVIGQYQANQSDFDFIRLSFGIPELFAIHGMGQLSGQFSYDTAKQKFDYIRGSSRFGMQANIKGSIFTLYGTRLGKINWEYLNSQNWQIELRNAISASPVRADLRYFVLSQNTLEKDALSFDGEIEFNPMSFKTMFGLELDRRTSDIRHRIVGKWDMVRKSWELSRLETQKRVPQVKLKWNDFDIAFQWQNFKLSGRGAQADHFGFHYELDMSNIDWKDKNGNALIGTQAKMEGDCILSLADDTLKPVSTGKISCEVADGAFGDTRFFVSNAFLNFSPDANGGSRYYFSCGEFKFGLPDMRSGMICTLPQLTGAVTRQKLSLESPTIQIKYKNILDLAGKKCSIVRNGQEKNIRFDLPELKGKLFGRELYTGQTSCDLVSNEKMLFLNGKGGAVKYDGETFACTGVNWSLEGDFPQKGNFVCRRIVFNPVLWKLGKSWGEISAPQASWHMTFNEQKIWHNWIFEAEKSKLKYKNKEFVLARLTAGELNHGKYCDGLLKSIDLPHKFDITYTRKNSDIDLKNGRFTFAGNILWGLRGNAKLQMKDDFFKADMQYAEFKPIGLAWENGDLGLNGNITKGFNIFKFNGMSAVEMAKVNFIGRNKQGENEYEVKNLPALYVEKTLGVPRNTLSGMFNGRITTKRGAIFNPFNIQTFYLKNNNVMRMRLEVLEKYARKGNSVEDSFAADALKDFFAKTLTLDYHKVGDYMVLDVNTLGKCTNLLPYEYDVKAKKLKKSDLALFNSEVEVSMKYMMKKP